MEDFSFRDELQQNPINLIRASLRFAQEIAYPGLDPYVYLARLDHLARSAQQFLDPEAPVQTKADGVADFLFRQLGFSGNSAAYHDPRNSYLNEVLDRRLGIPISLTVIFISVAYRLGLPVFGVGLPGHFIAGVRSGDKVYYYDPFHGGGRLDEADCEQLVRTTIGYSGVFNSDWLQPVSASQILTRMLNNLRLIYIQSQKWDNARRVIHHLRLLQPDQPELLRDLGFVYHQSGKLNKAVSYYELYLLRGKPPAEEAEAITRALRTVAFQLARRN
jgi:regulator of sirC expression with transglutaminase-like and TPR domain